MGVDERVADHARDRFAKQVLAAAEESGLAQVWYDPGQYAIAYQRLAGERPAWFDLEPAYSQIGDASGTARRRQIQQLVVSMVNAPALPQVWAEAASTLRPVVQSASYALTAPIGGPTMVSRAALPNLAQYTVIEMPAAAVYVTQELARGWGVAEDDIFAQAWANLAATTPPNLVVEPVGRRPLRFVGREDPYFAARVLLPGRMAALSAWVDARPVVFMPDRSTIIVSPDSPESLARVYEVAASEYSEAIWPLSPQGYTLDEKGAVMPYQAPTGHPVAAQVRGAAALLSATEYETQARLLAARPDITGPNPVLGSVNVVRAPDESIRTVTTWSGDLRELLPIAEYVMVRSPEEDEVVIVPWRVATEAFSLQRLDGIKPPRYRVGRHPSEETWQRLRPAALDSQPAYVPRHGRKD